MILIPEPLLQHIYKDAEASYPEECCGLLAGNTNGDQVTVSRIAPSANVAASRHDRFEVDPKVRFELMRELGQLGGDGGAEHIIGHYHSHPDHGAVPSAHDLKMAFEPDLLWLIVSVKHGRATGSAAFAVDADAMAFHEVPLNRL